MPCGILTTDETDETETYVIDSDSSGGYSEGSFSDRLTSARFHSTTGQCTPNFYQRRRSGELLPYTNFRSFKSTASAGGTLDTTRSVGGVTYRHRAVPLWVPPTTDESWRVSAAELEALASDTSFEVQKAAAKVYSQGFDATTFLAELKQTRKMFTSVVRRVIDMLKDPRRFIQDAPGAWLEIRYGWRPLLNDILSLENAIASMSEPRKLRHSAFAETKTEFTDQTVDIESHYFGTLQKVVTSKYTISMRGTVAADILPPIFQTNLVKTLWETTRLSFVLDWIVNVGQWLDSSTFLLLNSKYVACGGFKITCFRTTVRTVHSWEPDYSGSVSMDLTDAAELRVRYPRTIPTTPLVRLRMDEFKEKDLLLLLMQKARQLAVSEGPSRKARYFAPGAPYIWGRPQYHT